MDTFSDPLAEQASAAADFLAHGGVIGTLLRRLDWHDSPLGPPDSWPDSLKTLMATVLPTEAQVVLFWGPHYVALYNEAYAPTIGAKHPLALGRPAIEHWAELWDDLEPLLRGVRETGRTFSAKDRPFYIERSGHGETVYFDVSYSAVRDVDGSIQGVLCLVNETTERVHFEQRQAFLLSLGHALRIGADPAEIERVALRLLGTQLQASGAFLAEDNEDGASFRVVRAHGTPPLAGTQRYEAFAPGLLGRLMSGEALTLISRAAVDGEPARFNLFLPLLRNDRLEAFLLVERSAERVFESHEVLMAEEAAKLIWLSLTHARAEAAVHASSAELSAMFDQASAGIAVCDENGRFLRTNERYRQIVDRTHEALLGESMQSITYHDDLDACLVLYERAVRFGAPFEITKRYVRPDQSLVWVQSHITPLLGDDGKPASILCVSVDISARITAETELRELNETLEERVVAMVAEREAAMEQLHEAHKMKVVGQLTGGIAHDFNNLLTPIMASLELIRRRLDDERSVQLIDGALQSADRARVLVGRLLTFARRQTLKPRPVMLAELLGSMHDLVERSLGPTIEVVLDIPAELPPIMVDPYQLELAILNLAVNARDAMGDGGRLEIAAVLDQVAGDADMPDGRYVRISVADDGCGMDAEVLARCVEPFFSTKGVGKGTGLGLSMVQGLALQSGGGFDIHSEPGLGTQVSLWLPIAEGGADSLAGEQRKAPTAARFAQVLLVDDEELVRRTTALQLRELGYEVTVATSAAAALREVDEGLVPDLLVTDHLMADKSGAQLAVELRKRFPELPVLIVTGYTNLSAEQLSGFEVLTKPFRRAELAESVARLLL